MRKFFLALMIVLALCPMSFAADNNDVYVRKDLLESYMRNIDSKLDNLFKEQALMREDIKSLSKNIGEINAGITRVEARMEGLEKRVEDINTSLSARINDLREDTKGRIGDLNNSIYLWSVVLGLVAGLPFFKSMYDDYEAKKKAKQQSFTLEEVEKLFERMFEAKKEGNLSNAV